MKLLRPAATISLLCIIFTAVFMSHSADTIEHALSRFIISEKSIPGWAADEHKKFGPDELYDIINGGADVYIDNGLKKGIHQRLIKDTTRQCEIFVEEYGSSQNAKKLFAVTTENATDSLKDITGATEQIRIKEFIGGVLVYMQYKKYYFEISMSGFATVEEAAENVVPFIDFFRNVVTKK